MKADAKSGPNRDTAASFAITAEEDAITHLRDVHRIGQNGPLAGVTAGPQRIQQAPDDTVPRVIFKDFAFQRMLIRWIATYNIPLQAVESDMFRLILVYLAACVSSYSSCPLAFRY